MSMLADTVLAVWSVLTSSLPATPLICSAHRWETHTQISLLCWPCRGQDGAHERVLVSVARDSQVLLRERLRLCRCFLIYHMSAEWNSERGRNSERETVSHREPKQALVCIYLVWSWKFFPLLKSFFLSKKACFMFTFLRVKHVDQQTFRFRTPGS